MLARPAAKLPRVVYAIGAVSFCTDLASEMIVPLLPALMATLGSSMVQLGLMQGLSELVVALLKIASGRWSDARTRKPWIVLGYTLSTLLRPLFAIVTAPWHAVLVRSFDRVGKGLRSAPRDALLTDVVDEGQRGAAFGVQRAMDHAGALGGALLGFLLLELGCELRTIFALALVPGLLSLVVLWFGVHEAPRQHSATVAVDPPDARARLLPFLVVVVLSAAAYGVDLFALTRLRDLGCDLAWLPLLWAALHVVRSLLSAPLGRLSDRVGRRRLLLAGLLGHAVVLGAFAMSPALLVALLLFPLLGVPTACNESAERGFVADLTGAHKRGAAFGLYHAVQGCGAFVGALAIGWLWDHHGAPAALGGAAGVALLAALALGFVPARRVSV